MYVGVKGNNCATLTLEKRNWNFFSVTQLVERPRGLKGPVNDSQNKIPVSAHPGMLYGWQRMIILPSNTLIVITLTVTLKQRRDVDVEDSKSNIDLTFLYIRKWVFYESSYTESRRYYAERMHESHVWTDFRYVKLREILIFSPLSALRKSFLKNLNPCVV